MEINIHVTNLSPSFSTPLERGSKYHGIQLKDHLGHYDILISSDTVKTILGMMASLHPWGGSQYHYIMASWYHQIQLKDHLARDGILISSDTIRPSWAWWHHNPPSQYHGTQLKDHLGQDGILTSSHTIKTILGMMASLPSVPKIMGHN